VCRSAGIAFMYDLLIGGPGETEETVRETIELAKRVRPDCVGMSLGMRIYGGTTIAEEVLGQGAMETNPALRGETRNNPDFLRPVYYVSPGIGGDIVSLVRDIAGNDRRFFLPSRREESGNYNYNDNTVLVRAIREGARGAYWDILRRIAERGG
jgi:hypothetical protein